MFRFVLVMVVAAALAAAARPSMAGPPDPSRLERCIRKIVKADYAGDRRALERLDAELDAFLGDRATESRVRYWKGFARWRRAMNGANEKVTPPDLAADAETAARELRRSGELDPAFVDARIGEMQCIGLEFFFDRERAGDTTRVARLRALMGDLRASAADHPRYVWAWGMAYFNAPADKGGGPANVIAAYQRALEGIRNGAGRPTSPLDPSWGEAELHVNLAYSYLNRPGPDLVLARKHVDEALRLVPYWHYARDVLRPQIEAASRKPAAEASEG